MDRTWADGRICRTRTGWLFFESSSRSIFLFEHDLRANASRLSRGKTGIHFSGSCSSDLGTAALGLARQLSRTGAARLTDVCITAERGSVSHMCVPLGNRKTFQKSDACSLATIHLGCEETSGDLEPLASIERQTLMQVRLGSLRADNAQQGGA